MARSYSSFVDHFSPQDQSLDAPFDGQTYGRQDGEWVPVSSGGGGGDSVQKTGDTMTGTLVITSPNGSALLDWENPGTPSSVKIDTAASGWPTLHFSAQGVDSMVTADSAGNLKILASELMLGTTGQTLVWQDPGGWLKLQKLDNQDLVATSSAWSGQVNLTNGGAIGITIVGDQFDEGINPGTAIPAFQIKSSANLEGFKLGQFGGLEVTGPRGELVTRGAGFTHYDSLGNRVAICNDPNSITFNCYGGKVNITQTSDGRYLSLESNYTQTGLAFDRSAFGQPCTILAMDSTTGDILAIATAGPNAGMSVNLTNGFANGVK
jgi:hypothetical protein